MKNDFGIYGFLKGLYPTKKVKIFSSLKYESYTASNSSCGHYPIKAPCFLSATTEEYHMAFSLGLQSNKVITII